MPDLPIVCTLQPDELSAKAMQMLPGIAALAMRRLKIANGYRLEFAEGKRSLSQIVTMVEAERRCCRFLRFQLAAEPGFPPFPAQDVSPCLTQRSRS